MGMQIGVFERAEDARWRQLPEKAREQVIELLARMVLEYVAQRARQSEAGDDR